MKNNDSEKVRWLREDLERAKFDLNTHKDILKSYMALYIMSPETHTLNNITATARIINNLECKVSALKGVFGK